MSQLMKKRFPSIISIDIESDGNTSFLRAARNGQLDKVLEHLKSNIDINTSNANGLNALHLASKDGHVEIVEELLRRGAVVDAATKKGNTALHIASLAGQEEVVKLLVQHGASVNVQSQNGFTPLYMAAQENHDNVVKYLLANGANQSLSTEDGFTPLAVAMQQGHDKVVTVLLENDTRGKIRLPALHIAAKKDDVKAAKLLLENEHNPDVTSKSGFTPLHIASHYGNQQIANLLIQKGADVNYAAKHNITPLHVAAKWGKTNMVALLLEHGATIESKTRDGLTPLHCAARSGHEQVVDMLLERGAPISSKTKNGLAPLHMAAQGDHVDAARILLYHRAPVDEVTVDYLTALHVAAHCGHVRVAKLLLDRQADANARALNGFTPLHIACKKNRIKVVELLLKHGASIGATTESGLTPLHVASFMGCMNIVIYLLQHDANPDVPTVRGETPLHLAARANQTDIIRILLRNGAQVDARAREQQTPLHIASRLGNVDIVMLLLQHGAKVDNTTKDMYTALHIAAKEGQDEVAAVLLDNGASLDATTKKGFTPLHLAAKYGHLKVAKLLLQKEAPVDAQGKNGVTPLHVASHYDHQNVALLLLDKGASPHATAKNGHTPLHIAARKNQMDIANTLLEYGAHPNAESKAGFTPLHLSAQEGHADMSSLLLEHKADANYEAKNGLTPLHLCAQEDRVPVADILVKNGADVNAFTKGGYTPLHIASHYGQTNMVRFLLQNGANVKSTTSLDYTPLHQAAQQGHANIVNILLENDADPNAVTTNGQTPLNIAQKLGYITVIETLKVVTTTTTITTTTTTNIEEKYRVQAPELMHETFMSDSEEEGGEDTVLGDQTYRYLTADEMKSLGDDSLPIDVTRDERIDSNRMVSSADSNMLPPQHIEDSISPEHVTQNYVEYIKKYTPDNVDIGRHPINIGFLVSFLVDARGGAMRGCRHSGVRVIVPPRSAPSPTRITCRYVRPQRTPHPPPLMEGEALASRVLELGPVGAKFLGPVIIEVPHFAALRGKEREIVILRSDNGESWKEHTVEATEEILNEVLHDSFEAEDLNQLEDMASGRITRILTQDFPQYFAVVSRIRQEVHAIGPEGGMVSSTVVPQVQAVFPEGALTKKIKVGLQAQPIDPELTAKLLGHGVAVSPVVTVEPRRRKFHKAITLSMPAPRAHSQGMINQYSGSAPTLRLLCSITGGTTRAQWEDVTGSTPLTFVNDCVSFTTTVSARFWLMDCRNIGDATKMATELYKEAIHVPFMAKFVVFAKRVDPLEARLRVFCMTDDKEDKTLEQQEHFTEVAKSRDVEVLEGKLQYVEFAGNLVPITKSGEQLSFSFRAFRENRLPFSVRVKDQHAEAVSRCLFMKEPKVPKGEPPQQPICILNIVLPDDIVTDTISLTDTDSLKKHTFFSENFDYYRPDPRLSDMSNLLGEDWVPLANQLGLTTSEINVIKSEYPDSVAKQAQSMLRMWLSQSGNKAQTNTLENALRRIGREDIIPQCLNVDHTGQTITRIKQEEIGKYRLKKDIDIIDKEVVARDEADVERFIDEKQKVKRKLDSYDKYSAEEKAIEVSDEEEEEDTFDKPVAERREQIEKRLSAERTIPASSQRREIVQEITSIKRQSIVEDKIAEVQQKATPDQKIAPDQMKTTPEQTKTTPEQIKTTPEPIKPTTSTITTTPEMKTVLETIDVKTTIQPEPKVSEAVKVPPVDQIHELKTTIVTETRTIQPIETTHRTTEDAELLEGVTQSLEKTKKPIPKLIADEDPKSPKFSKTPPPSPADFLTREQAATVQEWEASRKPADPESKTLEKDVAQQEISCEQLTDAASPLTPAETKQLPQPKPRSAKSPETPPNITQPSDDTKSEKPVSPVRDDLLDEYDIHESYSDKKKFWESVTKDPSSKKISLSEVDVSEKESAKTLPLIHEVGMPPVPKPRTILHASQSLIETESETREVSLKSRASLQTSQSVIETEKDELRRISVKDRAMSFESTTSESVMRTDLSKISESYMSPIENRIMTEYQASFQPPTDRKRSPWKEEKYEKVELKTELQKTDSVESDVAEKGSSQFIENSGYISDSEDVEQYISDSEIEDRVPQIRDRLMSVFVPSASSARKSIYERSASLPTEDMYEVSARNIKLRKEYYEEQIRKEMIEEQLTSEIEEEPSPEKKALLSSTEEEHTDADAKSIAEEIDEDIIEEDTRNVIKLAQVFGLITNKDKKDVPTTKEEKISSVKSLARSFEEKNIADTKTTKDIFSEKHYDKYAEEYEKHEKVESSKEKTSVKDLAKGYEKQLGNVVAGQRIGQSPSELRGFILDKHAIDDSKRNKTESSEDILDFMEISKSYTAKSDKENIYKVEDQFSVSLITQSETHKDTETDAERKTFESQQSISSDKSTELTDEQNFKDNSHSTKPDSMEVLVDKSEIEDTEKLAELDQDFEGKSFDSLDTEGSPKISNFEDEAIPEIRVTLSGKQRRISEESDEYADKPEAPDTCSPIVEKSEEESPIKVPEEHIQDTVWEVSVESHLEADFDEKVEDIVEQKPSVKLIQEFIATEKAIGGKSVLQEKDFISEYSAKDIKVERKDTPTELKQTRDQQLDLIENEQALADKLSNTDSITDIKSDTSIYVSTKKHEKESSPMEKHIKKNILEEEHLTIETAKRIYKEETEEGETVASESKQYSEIKASEKPHIPTLEKGYLLEDDKPLKGAKEETVEEKSVSGAVYAEEKFSVNEFIEAEKLHSGKDYTFSVQSEGIQKELEIQTKASTEKQKEFETEQQKTFEKISDEKQKESADKISFEKGKIDISQDDLKKMIDQQEEISEQLEAKLRHQRIGDTSDYRDRKSEPQVLDDAKFEKLRPQSETEIVEDLRSDRVEKDDDLSSSVRDESDLGSEIHQDHSDSNESDRIKSESHSDIEKIILDSLHQQKVHPEEAKKIASALIEEIEAEIQKRDSLPIQRPLQSLENVQVSEFLKNLAETKGLDEREVELVESVLARRQRGLAKLTRGDTQASSMEITDEDLKYSGTEMDYSHILEQQMDQLEAEKIDDVHLDYFDQEQAKRFQDKSGYVDRIDEEHSEETVTSHDFESYEDSKVKSIKKDIFIKSSDTVKGETAVSEMNEVIFKDDETISESTTEESEKLSTHIDTAMKEVTQIKSNDKDEIGSKEGIVEADIIHTSKIITDKTELKGKDLLQEKSSAKAFGEDTSVITAKFEENLKSREVSDTSVKEIQTKTEEAYDEISKKEHEISTEEIIQLKKTDDGSEIETKLATDKKHSVFSSKVLYTDRVHEETTSVSSQIIDGVEDLEKLISTGKLQIDTDKYKEIKPEQSEIIITSHEIVKRTSSSESKSSTEAKSPEDQFSTASSGKREESDTGKTSDKEKVIFRKTKSDADTSSSSSNLKPDRKSGVEFEAYSSSGESHYHSFEMDSGKSRPCSSDVEGLVAAGSSEYESALTSQEYSARTHMTSTEYQTAVSSMSSKESMKSLDSESSGNLASVEVSEHSETLVPSTSDLDDILDSVDQPLFDEPTSGWTTQGAPIRQSTEVSDSELLSYTVGESIDVSEEESTDVKITDMQSKMKRSQEMTFQPEPKALVVESPQGDFEEKLGTSLDEGSILSVSVSSTSSTGAQRTVIELSRADSERFDGSMTVSGTSEHLSLDDVENMPRGSRESLIYTPTSHITSDISTSTPQLQFDLPIESVTITTSIIDENGIQSVSTQVTSETQSPVEEHLPTAVKPEEPKKKGHRRSESTSFMGSMINVSSATRSDVDRRIHSDLAESDKYTTKLSFKETSSDEKKDIDESEKEESYETEADQGFHRDLREGRYIDRESDNEADNLDLSASKSEPEYDRRTSTNFSKDQSDSVFTDLGKSTEIEPCDETKDDTPEFSSEAQASVGELEQEYSSAISRSQEILVSESQRSISGVSDIYFPKEPLEKRDSHGKSSSTSSEKSSFEEAEAEAAFNMVAHVSPAHKIKQICPILEDEDAEKHELETRERVQKEYEERRMQVLKDASPGFVPDIKITQHMTPLVDRNFRYPELELEAKEEEQKEHEVQVGADTPQTPASNSSKSSEETDQGREYVLDETVSSIPEEPEGHGEEKVTTESKSEVGTVIEATVNEGSEKGTDSPNSDSFEMLEKPDLIDDFVVIEEVGKEAQEFDAEGKSVKIGHVPKMPKKHDEELEQYLAHSAPTPLTRMTDIKYYPDGTSSSEELGFDFEESPPQVEQKNAGVSTKSGTTDYGNEYDKELEANRKWIEQQFQGDQAAMMAAGYGYEMEFERGPLEDIKEEDINDFAASSYGSQRESGGSVKDSYSSTPEYDVLAGRKYFTRSAEHDDVSMSSLQEFENLEQAMSLEMRKFHQGSQDSSSNGSFKARYYAGKSGQGDDISVSSLKEFEGLEKACIAAHKIEVKVKEEEALLTQIDEGQESIASESESCETGSGTEKKVITDTDDDEDYEKRMFEIDEIIRQAQTNVERFVDLKEMEKTESLGRGDSIEEVSKVPDLDLDTPLVKSTIKVQWKESDDIMITSTDSLDLKVDKPSHHDSTDSLDQKTGGDIMTASTDSIEFQAQKSTKDNIITDSIEIKGEEKSYMVSSDSLELGAATSSGNNLLLSDSIDEDGSRIGGYDQSSSSTGKDFSSSAKEDDIIMDQDGKGDLMLESTESLDPTSSTATHATYQYDTDSIFSGSFTSGGSNTMVSSTNSIDQSRLATGIDVAAAVRKVWFDEEATGPRTTEYIDDSSKPYVTEVIEPCEDDYYSHTIHRRVELPPEVRKLTFTGSDADEQMKQFIRDFNEGEDVQETEEIDEDGNVHVKKVVQRRFIVKSDGTGGAEQAMSGTEIEDYFKQLNQPESVQQGVITKTISEGHGTISRTITDGQGSKTTITQQFDIPQTELTTLTRSVAGGEEATSSTTQQPSTSVRAQVTRRRPLRYEISIEDQTEVDPREHDWRFNLPKHAEGEEAEKEETGFERQVPDQHQLSEEMKELLKELEKESKQ